MTLTELNELRAQRAARIADARKLNDKVHAEKRDFTTDEQKSYDDYLGAADKIKSQVTREERLLAEESEARKSPEERAQRPGVETPETSPETEAAQRSEANSEKERRSAAKYRSAFNKFLTRGRASLTQEELRDLSSDSDVDGGYLVTPMQMAQGILKNVDDMVHIRAKARKFQLVKAKSLGAIKRSAKLSTFTWGGEITPPTPDTSLKFQRRTLSPHYLSGLALVSRDLLLNSTEPADSLVMAELGRDAGEIQEQAFLLGNGDQKPLGVMVASDMGISTGRDFSAGNTGTAITFDGLIEAKFGLKGQYRGSAEWMFHRDAIKMISKLKDGEGQYLWQPSRIVGEPDRLLNLPYTESEWMPNTFTTGQYVGILANWGFYWIADGLDIGIQRLQELYALSNQDGFVARLKTDGMPQIEEAFSRVKLG